MNSGNSTYSEFAGTVQQWCLGDTEELWNQNYANASSRRNLLNLGWTTTNVTYKFNEYGFRSDEFEGDGALFLGCSHTVGTGIDWERTWAYKVANALNLKCWNLGIAGSSNDTAFRIADYWIPLLKPKKVFYLAPMEARIELFTSRGVIQCVPNYTPLENNQFYLQWLTNPINYELNYKKNKLAVQQICSSNSIPLSIIDDSNRWNRANRKDLARDLLHSGVQWNELIAQRFLSKKD